MQPASRSSVTLLLLALASTVRPTSLAAVSTLLTRESRRRLMLAYVAGGLAFTMAFGLVVVGVFHGVHLGAGSGRTKAVADLVGGTVALVFGVTIATGLVRGDRSSRSSSASSWSSGLDRRLTVRVAALAGPLTHFPGIFYLIALNVIVAHNPRLPVGVVAVGIYNGVWFALPLAALVLCMASPDASQRVVASGQDYVGRNSRTIVLATSFVAGTALVVRGLVHL